MNQSNTILNAEKLNKITKDSFENWIFDLDNTLYDIKLGLFQKISERITLYIMEKLYLKKQHAEQLRRKMFKEYGLTLRGLMLERNIDPDSYLDFVHDVAHPELVADSQLKNFLKKLHGKKFIYTNASKKHALNVLDGMGLIDQFDDILDIKGTNYVPKPDPRSYETMIRKFKIVGEQLKRTIFFEDTAKNLRPAKMRGLATVFIKNDFNHQDYEVNKKFIDFRCDDIKDFFNSISLDI